MFPKEAMSAFEAGDTATCEGIIHKAMEDVTSLRWSVTQGLWSFDAEDITDYLNKTKLMTMEGVAQQICCSCLVLEAEGDQFFRGQPHEMYNALTSPKTLFEFTSEDGAENHCQSGALAYKDEVVFNWLDDAMKSQGAHK